MSKALEISISLSYLSVFLYILKLFLLSYSEFVFYNNAREVIDIIKSGLLSCMIRQLDGWEIIET